MTSSRPSARTAPPRGLFAGLLDDASLFPPASLPMARAVAAHVRHRTAWYADLAGPFVCPHTRLAELGAALTVTALPWINVSVVVTGGAEAVADAADAVAADPRLRLRALEVPAVQPAPAGSAGSAGSARWEGTAAAVRQVADALDAVPLPGAAGCIEVPLSAAADPGAAAELFALIDRRGYRPKLRTGGVTLEAFPSEDLLARCLAAAGQRRVPVKCTAGLHHGVRHTAADTGLEHHGFLNVLLAVGAAVTGEPAETVASILALRDSAAVAAQVRALDQAAAEEIRFFFTSFGTCSTDEPVADLVGLGLLSPA